MGEIKRIDLAEFVDEGYLQELNRLFLHPLGLALEVVVDKDLRPIRFGGVWDCRDDPEGILYDDDLPSRIEKAERIRQIAIRREPERIKRFDFWIQPFR